MASFGDGFPLGTAKAYYRPTTEMRWSTRFLSQRRQADRYRVSYQPERHPVGRTALRTTDALLRLTVASAPVRKPCSAWGSAAGFEAGS